LVRDPDYNVRLGSWYLGQQLARHGGEAALALAAYNAGPGRVARWIGMNGDPRGADPYRVIDWIELIPFAETRNYVQRVLEGRTMYRAMLAGPKNPPARTAADSSPAVPRAKPAS
jgi:soluble lytic murein transglycosylase